MIGSRLKPARQLRFTGLDVPCSSPTAPRPLRPSEARLSPDRRMIAPGCPRFVPRPPLLLSTHDLAQYPWQRRGVHRVRLASESGRRDASRPRPLGQGRPLPVSIAHPGRATPMQSETISWENSNATPTAPSIAARSPRCASAECAHRRACGFRSPWTPIPLASRSPVPEQAITYRRGNQRLLQTLTLQELWHGTLARDAGHSEQAELMAGRAAPMTHGPDLSAS
jgi:hypothetical protein